MVRNNRDIKVVALAAGSNIRLLEQQIREFRPKLAAVWSEENAKQLRLMVRDLPTKIVWGMEAFWRWPRFRESEILVTAIVGMIGIRPTVAAIRCREKYCAGQ